MFNCFYISLVYKNEKKYFNFFICLGTYCGWIPEQSMFACICPTGTYFSVVSQACVSYVLLGQICIDSTYCSPNATCLWQNSTSDMRCQCTVSTFYQANTSTCLYLNGINGTCTSTSQCQATLGLACINGYCQCPSNYYWDEATCVTQLGYESYSSYGQTCVNSFQCKIASNLTDCFLGHCRCPPNMSYNSGTYRCN